MSDKDRQKKDNKRKDKENEAMRGREAQGQSKEQGSLRKIEEESDVPNSQPDIKRRSA